MTEDFDAEQFAEPELNAWAEENGIDVRLRTFISHQRKTALNSLCSPVCQMARMWVKRKIGGRRGEKNAVPPFTDEIYAPVTIGWRVGSGFPLRHPIAVPDAGLYPLGRHHRPVRSHAPGG